MFLSVNSGTHELVIKKSRFIALSYTVGERAEVRQIIDGLKRTYHDATHVCYGFITDDKGDEFGYDDDGEPSGTAGKPIYAALAAAEARHTLIAVVRYFGGIKLGAGGLTRAYRQAASELIDEAGMAETRRYTEYSVECEGGAFKIICAVLKKNLCKTQRILYNERVGFTVLAPEECDVRALIEPLGASLTEAGTRYLRDPEDKNENTVY